MINNQFSICSNCGLDEKFILQLQGIEILVCKYECKVNKKVNKCTCSSSSQIGICHHCNTAIGHFRDNTKILKSAIKYLEENK